MGIGDKFRDKAQQAEEEAKQRIGSGQPQQDEAQQKASQAQQQGQQNLDDVQDDIEGQQ
ncbi:MULTISPECIES: hypothetical protein [unclassified Kitasatospora]|uniref:hypothetical protein n=1 Tax=unclassified Kitasatospora TaxID=2633591 RepID=UPI0036880B1C